MITKSTIFKRLLPLALAAFTVTAKAQTVTFSLIDPPCNYDGVLGINIAGIAPPVTVTWQTYGTTATTFSHTITGSTDAFTAYPGGPVTVTATNGVVSATNTYAGTGPFSYVLTTTPAACPAPGTASVAVTGGTPPYTYQWYNAANDGVLGSGTSVTVPTGNYGVTITDAAGCKYGSRVNNDMGTGYVYYVAPFTATVTTTPANCTNGTATVAAVSSGATTPLSYQWSNGGTTQTITGLTQGSYSVWVTDALGCHAGTGTISVDAPISVSVAQTTVMTATVTPASATCSGSDGVVSVAATGGTAPYSYLWNNGATTATQAGVRPGIYEVTVKDANGCTATATDMVGSAASSFTASATASPSLCTIPSGNATVSASGGTAPYSILWHTAPAQTGVTATSLAPGTYTYRITDAAGCVRFGTVTVPAVSNIRTSFSANSAVCSTASGSLTVMPVGGTAPYSYLWSNGATAPTISGVTPGYYSVTVTDNLNCKVTVSHILPANSPVGVGVLSTPASCVLNNDGTVAATPFGGTVPYAYGWSSGGTTGTLTSLPTGPYWVNVTDATGCTVRKYAYVPYNDSETNCYCTIAGVIFNDTNSNCLQDAGETGLPNIQVMCSGRGYTYTDANGYYSFKVPSGSYVITQTVEANHPLASCQSNGIAVVASAAAGCVNTVNFANTSTATRDIRISTWDYSRPVAGAPYRQITIVRNDGNTREDSVLTSFSTANQFMVPFLTPSTGFTGTSPIVSTPAAIALEPGQTQVYYRNYNTPANITTGTNVTFRDTAAYNAPLSLWADDYTPANNVSSHVAVVAAATAPNFKDVHPKGTGTNGLIYNTDSVLEYMVHFQNTQNVGVQDVMVIDTIDNNLDWTTLRPVYMSAPAHVTLTQSGAFRIATFTFNNINLATATADDARSQGLLTYTVKMRSGLTGGTQLRNRAAIYFDHHEPVITNSTLNTLSTTPGYVSNTASSEFGSLTVYPNPANGTYHIGISNENDGTGTLTIADITGKIMMSNAISLTKGSQTVTADASQLAPGVYLVSLSHSGKTETAKLVVIK